jgi:hypothetical protein
MAEMRACGRFTRARSPTRQPGNTLNQTALRPECIFFAAGEKFASDERFTDNAEPVVVFGAGGALVRVM